MKKVLFLLFMFCFSLTLNAQSSKVAPNYEISIQLKNFKDTVAYLNYYDFGNKITAATCNGVKNDKIIFKGKGKLKTGLYSLHGKDKKSYLDFFIDESTQKLELKSDDAENYLKGVVVKLLD